MLAIALGINLHGFYTNDNWVRWVQLGVSLVMVWAFYRLHANRRYYAQLTDHLKWQYAAGSKDPVASLAAWEYLEGLPHRERKALRDWFAAHHGEVIARDDMPPEVRRYFEILAPRQ